MAENGGTAFARLFSERRDHLNMSVVDIAVQIGRPMEVVISWDQGTASPDADDLVQIAKILRLPPSLLDEAMRRVAEYRQVAARVGPGPEAEADDSHQPEVDETTGDGPPKRAFSPVGGLTERSSRAATAMSSDPRRTVGRGRRVTWEPVAHPSYIEDPEQVTTYRLRMVFTVAGVAALVLILRWSLGGLGSAISELWGALTRAL